jgi:hypothetical protein
MIPIPANIPWRLIGYGAAALAVILALGWLYTATVNHGRELERAEWEERQRAAEAEARANERALQAGMSEIDTSVVIDMEAVSNVRTVYRDRVDYRAVEIYRDRPDCSIPGGLLEQVNAAASGFAAAATGSGIPTVRPSGASE